MTLTLFSRSHSYTLKCPKYGFRALSTELVDGFSPNLAKIHYWEKGNSRLDFGDLDLIIKVTPAF